MYMFNHKKLSWNLRCGRCDGITPFTFREKHKKEIGGHRSYNGFEWLDMVLRSGENQHKLLFMGIDSSMILRG